MILAAAISSLLWIKSGSDALFLFRYENTFLTSVVVSLIELSSFSVWGGNIGRTEIVVIGIHCLAIKKKFCKNIYTLVYGFAKADSVPVYIRQKVKNIIV